MKKGIVIILVILLTIGAGFIIPIMINKDVGGANNPSVNVTYTPGGTEEPLSTQKSDKSPGMSFESTPRQLTLRRRIQYCMRIFKTIRPAMGERNRRPPETKSR